jgi:hypothetical protein
MGVMGMVDIDTRAEARQPAREHPGLVHLHAYWDGKRGGRAFPRKADIDPTEIPFLLGNIVLFEVLDGGADARCRIAGGVIEEISRRPLTGAVLSRAALPVFDAAFRAHLHDGVADGAPIYFTRRVDPVGDQPPVLLDTVLLPLSNDGAVADFVIGAMFPRLR